jgi:membrane protein implicated in regulation of membrane protease activity
VKPDLLVTAMVATFIFGTAVITALMGVMKVILGLSAEMILAFIWLPFLLMLLLEGIFIRLLMRRNRATSDANDKARANQHETNELNAAHARALPEPTPSVTEHTTRAFEPIYHDRNSK